MTFSMILLILLTGTGQADPPTLFHPQVIPGQDVNTVEMVNRHLKALADHAPPEALPDATTRSQWEQQRPFYHAALLGALSIDRDMFYKKRPVSAYFVGRDLHREQYTVRHLIYESLPGFWVSANLYVPRNRAFPCPAVAYFAGHSGQGKSTETYQTTMINLARKGYVVLAPDELGAGERAYTGQSNPYIYLCGLSAGGLQIWDGVRAIDYLVSRPDIVDAKRIGVTGRSGGGFQTFYLTAIDSRIACAAPVMYVASYASMIQSDQRHTLDNYLIFPRRTFEQHHVMSLIAPSPLFVSAGIRDFFPIQATEDTMGRARSIYELYQAQDSLDLLALEVGHKDVQPHREAVYAFFNHALDSQATAKEEAVIPEPKALLDCKLDTKTNATLATLAFQRSRAYPQPKPDRAAQQQAIREIMGMAQYFTRPRQLRCAAMDNARMDTHFHETIMLETESSVFVGLDLFHHGQARATVLSLGHHEALTRALLAQGYNVAAVTVRQGTNARNRSADPEYLSFCNSLFLGKPLCAQKVFDIIRSLDYLEARQDVCVSGKVALMSTTSTEGSMFGLLAAVLDERITCLMLNKPLATLKADSPDLSAWHDWSVSLYLPGLLKIADVDDLMAMVSPTPLLLSDVRDTANQSVPLSRAQAILPKTHAAHDRARFAWHQEFRFQDYVTFLQAHGPTTD